MTTPHDITALRQRQYDLFGHMTLPKICIELRQSLCGAADPWPDEDVAACVQLLKDRLESWRPSRPNDERFDNAMREVVRATLAEVDRRAE